MTDEEYVFHQDVRQKKRISYGAFHKKNGARSKKCNFPSDYMTKKELLKMNSEPITYDLKKFYTYEEFKKFPNDIAAQYIQRLTDTYHVGSNAIGTHLFGLYAGCLETYLRAHLIYDRIKWNGFTGAKARVYVAQFKHDIELAREDTEIVEVVEEPKAETPIDISVEEQKEEPVAAKEEIQTRRRHSGTYTSKEPEECPIPKPKQGRILKTSMIFDGFDMETFLFLSKRYEGQDIIVELNIRERGDEDA